MTLKERINVDFIEAFKAKNMVKKTFLGILKGEIQNEEGRGTATTDESVLVIVKKMEKSLKTTNTPESLVELEFLEPYLPTLMGEDKIREILTEYKNNGLSNVGQMMGEFNKSFKGLADNKLVSNIVKEVLS
jgi:uncharacterized protein YqeY